MFSDDNEGGCGTPCCVCEDDYGYLTQRPTRWILNAAERI